MIYFLPLFLSGSLFISSCTLTFNNNSNKNTNNNNNSYYHIIIVIIITTTVIIAIVKLNVTNPFPVKTLMAGTKFLPHLPAAS